MPDEQADFLSKLQQIEEVALVAGSSAKDSREQSSFRHIALIARTLKSRLVMGDVQVLPAAHTPRSNKEDKHSG
jgi:hypothetical protein